ncbi:hypothetical protein CDL15_Pgr017495 [Punica granatum]|uniref:Uncharacterized protein n=1 Tax=Punica granatum TaxID=22663 RepID=A0A218XIV5_PUNGR|nr:hypothetical protein CDL15_Pgr017495 [Punica granatum]PKI71977.1 hypothetical protein CRG98_007660 [Punica granatum]
MNSTVLSRLLSTQDQMPRLISPIAFCALYGCPGVFSVVIPWGRLVDFIDQVVNSDLGSVGPSSVMLVGLLSWWLLMFLLELVDQNGVLTPRHDACLVSVIPFCALLEEFGVFM